MSTHLILTARKTEKASCTSLRPRCWRTWAKRGRADLAAKEPEKERFFARLYHLDEPAVGHPGRGSEIIKLSLDLNVSPSTLYKWREAILADLLMAAVQAGVLKPF